MFGTIKLSSYLKARLLEPGVWRSFLMIMIIALLLFPHPQKPWAWMGVAMMFLLVSFLLPNKSILASPTDYLSVDMADEVLDSIMENVKVKNTPLGKIMAKLDSGLAQVDVIASAMLHLSKLTAIVATLKSKISEFDILKQDIKDTKAKIELVEVDILSGIDKEKTNMDNILLILDDLKNKVELLNDKLRDDHV